MRKTFATFRVRSMVAELAGEKRPRFRNDHLTTGIPFGIRSYELTMLRAPIARQVLRCSFGELARFRSRGSI